MRRTLKQKRAWVWRFISRRADQFPQDRRGCQRVGDIMLCSPFHTPWHTYVEDVMLDGKDRWARRLRAEWRYRMAQQEKSIGWRTRRLMERVNV